MPTPRQLAAQRDMALIVAMVGGAPGVERRGAEFWVTVARNLCTRHGCRTLAKPGDARPRPIPDPPPGGLTPTEYAALNARLKRR